MKSIKTHIILKFHLFLTVFALALITTSCTPQKINQKKNGQAHGLWIIYKDTTKTKMLTKGHYKNGEMVGKWYYYTLEGKLEHKDYYKDENISMNYYYDNGKLAAKGKAKIVTEDNKIHYYWQGKWYYYLEDGKLEKICLFEKGKSIKEDYKIKSRIPKYEDLTKQLKQIEKDFDDHNHNVVVESQKNEKSDAFKIAMREKERSDSIILIKIDSIIGRFGYPSKQNVGESNGVIFYIIGFANWKIKEKYLDVFRRAASQNDISQRDLAYFEDKYYLGKEGFQLYGTQSAYRNKEFFYYPVTDLQNLNERRKLRELEPVDLKLYQEKK